MTRELYLGTSPAPDLNRLVGQIQTREDFVAFTRALLEYQQHSPSEWENRSLGDYLEALTGWVGDMDGFFQNRGEKAPVEPSWKLLGQILLAATMYE